ncbi:MAG: sigma 54-interacting transcriptional regulator [Planctomycetes bacterium]|jgi:DNA-binding NtrC family response regulator/HAMP domain-containing protein|nr:sigma 54-interacting transcriptional regulator [Planctomycetota bacterium]
MRIAFAALVFGASLAAMPQSPPAVAISAMTPAIDGDLAEWPADAATVALAEKAQLVEGQDLWGGVADLSATFRWASDSNHLFLAGEVQDDQIHDGALLAPDRSDRIELHLAFAVDGTSAQRAEPRVLYLTPLATERPWAWSEASKSVSPTQSTPLLSGITVAARRTGPTSYQFEAAIPFHHYPSLRPGAQRIGANLVLRDHDLGDDRRPVALAAGQLGTADTMPQLLLPAPGPLVPTERGQLLAGEILADLPYLVVPLLTLVALVLLLRGWSAVRQRAPWLRPTLLVFGVVLFVAGWWLPQLLMGFRDRAQRERLEQVHTRLQTELASYEEGTLKSYRGQSRDRALLDLMSGRSIARQRYTTYRSLAEVAVEPFGPPVRQFDELPVRTYWLPLAIDRSENFQFDPALRGTRAHLVIGRPFVPSFTFRTREVASPRLALDLDFGGGNTRRLEVDFDRPAADGDALGRDFWEVWVQPIVLDRDLRGLSVTALRGNDLRLVGLSLEGREPGRIEPVSLGEPSRQGVLTDLRGPYPQDAGIELAPGAVAKVAIQPGLEPPQRLWFFYRAIYPGLPTANPGARVAEIVLHFGGGRQKRSLVLEHQVSMFYELAVHNTRDDPPEGSPASIALSWVDESQERHVNLGYPVPDLPTDAPLEAIEFRSLAEYRMRFRSVVFVSEKAAAPQDPPESSLVRGASPNEKQIEPKTLAALQGASLSIYRAGRLTESMLPLDARQELRNLPRVVAGSEPVTTELLLADGSRRLTLFSPLRGDGWDGAVLALSSIEPQWAAAMRSGSRWGLLLCLCSAPFLLVLLSEILAAATNLRLRLMAVTTVASLAPLGLLSLVLVQVLESGHATDVEDGMRATVRSALAQLDSQKAKVGGSAQRWLQDLAQLLDGRLAGVAEAPSEAAVAGIAAELQKLLAGQLPPEWRGGFLRLEWQPRQKPLPSPIVLVAGDERMANVQTPARLEPGVFMQWGTLLLGVRAELDSRGGALVLTAGRPLDDTLLGELVPGHDALLADVRGYPIAVAAARRSAALQRQQALDPATMVQRERALLAGVELGQPVVERLPGIGGELLCGSEVLRDLQDTPRALLVVEQPDQRASLDLAVGRIPVRGFFLLVAGSLVVLAVFLSFVVSGRISRPIERLELGAQALSRGQLETRVPVDDGGQIGRLTRAFNRMAADLQARLQDLQVLNRTMSELAAEQDESVARDVLHRFCRTHTPADSVRILLAPPGGQELAVFAGGDGAPLALPLGSLPLGTMVGAFALAAPTGELPAPFAALVPGCRSLVALPIVFGGQPRGLILLGFTRVPPLPVDLDLLSTVAAQAAVAFERCQLQRLSVQDPVTATFTPDYFRRRVTDEVALAQQRSRPLSMLAIVLGDGERRPRGLRRFAAVLREQLPHQAILAHLGGGQFHVALPGFVRAQAEASAAAVARVWGELVRQLPENEVEAAPPSSVVVAFPDEAPSSEFLFEALRARVVALATPGASAMESDESLQRAGVTAVSPAMRDVYGTLRQVAPTDLPILFEGETGVGKEVLTNLVHRWSRRAGGPLIKVHCASLPEALVASELFGHERGAFTGADRRKIGRFEQADGGTLFLDEVGEIPLEVQVKLLRVLQEGEVDRVGGSEPVKVNVRVVAATNRDMVRMVAEGTFREDLYYRLQGMVVKVPPLRERKQELASLVGHFRAEITADGHAQDRAWSTDAMDELYRQDWPGNIRQLRNTVFRAMVLARGEVVQQRDVQVALVGSNPGSLAAEPLPLAGVAPLAGPPVAGPVVASPATPAAVAPGSAAPGPTEPVVLLPRPAEPAEPPAQPPVGQPVDTVPSQQGVEPAAAAAPAPLPPRLHQLLVAVVRRGTYSTLDHMQACNLSHRTALRDLQALVQSGHLERVGSRRGAFYRPSAVAGQFLARGELPVADSDPV